MSYLIAMGGANMDTHIKSEKNIRLHDSNPSRVTYSPGGVARNIAENLARLGCRTIFLGAVGRDHSGRELIRASKKAGIDMSNVMTADLPTSVYIDFLGPDGDMFTAANDMSIIEELNAEYIEKNRGLIENASALVIDANPRPEFLEELCEAAAKVPVFADGTSAAKAERLLAVLPKLRLLKVNRDELSVLSSMRAERPEEIEDAVRALLDRGLFSAAVTAGSLGCYYADREDRSFFKALKPLKAMVNATGAGDAFCAGAVRGFIRGLSPEDMMLEASACGRITAASPLTICTHLTQELIDKEIKENEY